MLFVTQPFRNRTDIRYCGRNYHLYWAVVASLWRNCRIHCYCEALLSLWLQNISGDSVSLTQGQNILKILQQLCLLMHSFALQLAGVCYFLRMTFGNCSISCVRLSSRTKLTVKDNWVNTKPHLLCSVLSESIILIFVYLRRSTY